MKTQECQLSQGVLARAYPPSIGILKANKGTYGEMVAFLELGKNAKPWGRSKHD